MDYFVLFSAIAAAVIYFYWKFMKVIASVSHIPGPPAYPFVGNALMFVGKSTEDITKIGEENVKKYGHFNRILLGPKIIIFVGEPEDVEAMLIHGKTIEKSEEYEYTKDWIGEGLITSTGQKWFTRRKVITPAFHFSILQSFVEIFDRNADVLVNKMSQFDRLDIFPLTLLCALDNICEAAMGTKINAQTNSDSSYVRAVEEITSIITKRHFILPLRSEFVFKLSGYQAKQEKLLKILHGFTDSVIIARREELTKNPQNDTYGESETKRKSALIDVLLKATINGEPLSNRDIREEVDTFMFAGHDTTTAGIAFCLYCIAKHPKVQAKVYDEIIAVTAGKAASFKDLNDLNYLELVIKETLRIYPSVPFIGRKIKEDTAINGKMLPKGANVVMSPFIMGQNERIWKDPKAFIPERFELDNLTNMNPFAYLPFSAGPRNCIGMKFAMLEMKTTIAKVLKHFEISLEPGFVVSLKPEIVLKPGNGIKLRLKAR